MMDEWAVITGASRGIGKALVKKLCQVMPELRILAIGRSVKAGEFEEKVEVLPVDLATHEGRQAVTDRLRGERIRFLVHNSGLFGTQGFDSTTLSEFQAVQAINVEAPLFLTQDLRHSLVPGARVLLVGSKAGQEYMHHAVSYCMSKAGLFMVRQVLNTELEADTGIVMYFLCRPGIAATAMFDQWYSNYPEKSAIDLSLILTPELVSEHLVYLLTRVTAQAFRTEVFDIYDTAYHSAWVPSGVQPPRLPFIEKL